MRAAIAICVFLATLGGAAAAKPEDLIDAIRVGDADRVEALLQAGESPNEPLSDKGMPPLFEAIRMGNRGLVSKLLVAGADLEFIYRNDRHEVHTAYSYAVLYADDYVFRTLVAHGRNDLGDRFLHSLQRLVCSPDYCGNVLSMIAIRGGRRPHNFLNSLRSYSREYQKTTQDFLNLHGIADDDPDIRGRPLLPPLHAAAATGMWVATGFLLRAGADIDQRDSRGLLAEDYAQANKQPMTISFFETERRARRLIAAIESDDAGRVEQLLDAGLDPNEGGAVSPPPLAVAATAGHVEVARVLLARGAKVDSPDRHRTAPVIYAIEAGNLDVVRLLLANGAQMDGNAMHKATASGNMDIVRAFLRAGADPTVTYGDGTQPIHTAIQNGHIEIFRLLAEAGADIHAEWISEANGNYTTLSDAIAHGQTDLALELIQRGADTDKLICPGEAPCRSYLDIAAARGNVTLIRRFIAVGNKVRRSKGQVMASDGMVGMSPLMWAARNGNPQAVTILLEHGADVTLRNNFDCSALDYAILNGRDEAAAILRKAGATADQGACQSGIFK